MFSLFISFPSVGLLALRSIWGISEFQSSGSDLQVWWEKLKNPWFLLTDLTCESCIPGRTTVRSFWGKNTVGRRMSRSNYFSNRPTNKPLQQWRDPRDADHSKPINATKPQRFCQGESEMKVPKEMPVMFSYASTTCICLSNVSEFGGLVSCSKPSFGCLTVSHTSDIPVFSGFPHTAVTTHVPAIARAVAFLMNAL